MKKNRLRKYLILLLIMVLPVPVYADYGSIEIDGYYDDWEDKPHTEVYEGKNPPPGKINLVSLFRDETNAYVHIEYASINNQTIDNMRVNLYTKLGNEQYTLVPDSDFDSIDYDNEIDSNDMENINPETDPNDASLNEGTEGNPASNNPDNTETDTGNENGNSQGNGNGPNDSDNSQNSDNEDTPMDTGNDSNSNNTNDNADNSTNLNNEDTTTDESQQHDQILSGRPEAILIADNESTKDETADSEQTSNNDTEDFIPDQGSDVDTTEIESNNGEDKKDNNDMPGADNAAPDSNNDTGQNNEELDPETQNNTEDEDGSNPVSENNSDQENQEDQGEPQDSELDSNYHHPGNYGTWPFTVYQGSDSVGYGYFTRSEGEPDHAEFYIPLDTITDEVDGITEISMTIKKLGKQSIICVGADTAPYIGVAISSAIVLMSVAGYSYKKQRPLILKKGK